MASIKGNPIPSELNLNRKTRILEITFDDGAHFKLSCEYLRIFSPSAEAKAARQRGEWITGKQQVNIERITPVGNYAVQIVFDDNHDSGVYSWQTLYELGRNRDENWTHYLKEVQQTITAESASLETIDIRILYFATLVNQLGLESEQVRLPKEVNTVSQLLAWLRERDGKWSSNLNEGGLTVTVNRQFAQPDTQIKSDDDVSITPIYSSGVTR